MSDETYAYKEAVLGNLHNLLIAQQETNKLLKESIELLDDVNSKVNNLLTK